MNKTHQESDTPIRYLKYAQKISVLKGEDPFSRAKIFFKNEDPAGRNHHFSINGFIRTIMSEYSFSVLSKG